MTNLNQFDRTHQSTKAVYSLQRHFNSTTQTKRRKDEKKEVSQKNERVKKGKRKRLIEEIIQRTQHPKKRKMVIHKTRKS